MQYGSLNTEGYEALETICFTSSDQSCANNFNWFAVTSQDGGLFEFEDGIVGMSTYYNDYVTGPLLIQQLYS